MTHDSTICAISTPSGTGAIAVIRISGSDAITICESVFQPVTSGKKLSMQKQNTFHFGTFAVEGRVIDEVIVGIFRAPASYTGEDMAEISCHGSVYIQNEIMKLLLKSGAQTACPGEFTMRAFLNGKIDLSQAEGVADLISSGSEAAHRIALQQMRGGFSEEINDLRNRLLHFTSLIELELDFSEEDVEFADREQLRSLVAEVSTMIKRLVCSFDLGNVLKTGVPVAIAGEPNVGKSTLLNALLNEERAIVTDIAGTTRDYIEDSITINGILFRFIDTAGIRDARDKIESRGIELAFRKISEAKIVIFIVEATSAVDKIAASFHKFKEHIKGQKVIIAINKTDLPGAFHDLPSKLLPFTANTPVIKISAKHRTNLDSLISELMNPLHLSDYHSEDIIVTNARHYEALKKAGEAIDRVLPGLDQAIPGDLLAQDIREALHYLGEITGQITTDEVLQNIFRNFCIGK